MVCRMAIITVKHSIQVCDLCGDGKTEARDRVRLGVDRKWFNLDLCSRHAAGVQHKLREWGEAVGKASTITAGAGTPGTAEVREWAKANGHTVSERGRIAGTVMQAFIAAQTKDNQPDPEPTPDAPKPRTVSAKKKAAAPTKAPTKRTAKTR